MCGGYDDGFSDGCSAIITGIDFGTGDCSRHLFVLGSGSSHLARAIRKKIESISGHTADIIWVDDLKEDKTNLSKKKAFQRFIEFEMPKTHAPQILHEPNHVRCNYSTKVKKK